MGQQCLKKKKKTRSEARSACSPRLHSRSAPSCRSSVPLKSKPAAAEQNIFIPTDGLQMFVSLNLSLFAKLLFFLPPNKTHSCNIGCIITDPKFGKHCLHRYRNAGSLKWNTVNISLFSSHLPACLCTQTQNL